MAVVFLALKVMFQHTAARRRLVVIFSILDFASGVSTHSRPKAAGFSIPFSIIPEPLFQHTAARRRLGKPAAPAASATGVQHTAARRRLVLNISKKGLRNGFNTQPPEGGWRLLWKTRPKSWWFQHTAARRRLAKMPRK